MKEIFIKKITRLLALSLGLFIPLSAVEKANAADLNEVNSKINSVRENFRKGQKFKELKDAQIFDANSSSPKMWPNWGNWGNWANWNNWNNWNNWAKWEKWENWGNWANM